MDTPTPTSAAPQHVVTAVPVVVDADKDLAKGDKVPTVEAVLIDDLPRLEVDFRVKKARAIGSDDWVWRQIVLHGQKLDVIHKNAIVETFSTVSCELNEAMSATRVYQIVSGGEPRLTFCCPSETLYNKFATVFRASRSTEFWTFPPVDIFEDLVGVAKMIVETEAGLQASPVKAPVVPASGVTVAQVQTHLANLKAIYDAFPHFDRQEELYEHVLAIEADFVKALEAKTAADHSPPLVQQILKLYPEIVWEDGAMSVALTLQLDLTKCPTCAKPFSVLSQIKFHVGGKTLVCGQCAQEAHYETFKIAQLRKEVPTFEFQSGLFKTARSMPLPDIPRDGKAKSSTDRLWRAVFEYETTKHGVPSKAKAVLEERIMACLNRLDLVQLIYRQLLFMAQIVAHFDYWNHPTVIQAAIHRYDKFRVVANAPKAQDLAATLDILLGSDFLLARLGNAAFVWGQAFNEPYSSCALESNEPLPATSGGGVVQDRFPRDKWAKFTRLPSRGNRFVGVHEVFAVESLGYNAEFAHEGVATAVSVIGALQVDARISRGKFRHLLPQDATGVYMYRYTTELPSLAEKIIGGLVFGVAVI
ncbi:hypothetical protein AeMF1_000101 [Aphanomyces euteiches]|nr:hypothetical protein AeMF1_000101 [Aphanomyces euteiches]